MAEAGTVTAQAEERKRSNFLLLATNNIFIPVAIETSGVFSPESKILVRELGHQMEQVTGDLSPLLIAATLHCHSAEQLSLYLGLFQPRSPG